MNGANQAVSGGIGGFLAFFLLACALWLLMRSMNKRLQNVRYDEELEQQRQAADADRELIARPAPAAGGVPAAGDTRTDVPGGPRPDPTRPDPTRPDTTLSGPTGR